MTKALKDYSHIGFIYSLLVLITTFTKYILDLLINNNIIINDINSIQLIGNIIVYVLNFILLVPLMYIPNKKIENIDKKKTKFIEILKYFLISYFLMICSNIIGISLTTIISFIKGSAVINPLIEVTNNLNILTTFILGVVLAPIVEELLFRKFIIDKVHIHGKWTAIFISGLMFGLFHANLNQFVYAFVLGIFLAYIYVKKGNIKVCILLHLLINSIGFIMSVIIKFIDIDNLINMELSTINLFPIIILLITELLVFIIFIVGLVLFILNYKKIKNDLLNYSTNNSITITKATTTLGMILFIVIFVITIINQLLI